MNYKIFNLPITDSTFTVNPASPQAVGTPITWTGTGIGGSGGYEYKFRMKGPSTGGTWVIVQNWSADNTYVWTPVLADIGQSQFELQARTVSSPTIKTRKRNYRIQ